MNREVQTLYELHKDSSMISQCEDLGKIKGSQTYMQGSRGGRIKITPTILFLRLDTLNKLSVRLKGAAERLPEST